MAGWILARMFEGSTHGGLAAIMQLLKAFFPEWVGALDSLTALFGSLAVVLKDKGVVIQAPMK